MAASATPMPPGRSAAAAVGGLVGYQWAAASATPTPPGRSAAATMSAGWSATNSGQHQQRLCHRAAGAAATMSAGWSAYQYNGSISNAYATGPVSGSDDVGGWSASTDGSINNAYATGRSRARRTCRRAGRLPTTAASATPTPPGWLAARRLCRRAGRLPNSSGTISSSYWNTETAGQATQGVACRPGRTA